MKGYAIINKKLCLIFIVVAFAVAYLIDHGLGNKIDYWVHDSAVVYQARTVWQHSVIVALDDDVPIRVGRKQALPLFARAAEQLVAAGVKGVFLDARVAKEMEGKMPYAVCMETDGSVRWSQPECTIASTNQCLVNNSEQGNAPLRMSEQAIERFRIAPYLDQNQGLPDFLLFDWDASAVIPEQGVVSSDRLITKDSPIARWFDLSEDHAVLSLAGFINPNGLDELIHQPEDEICNDGRRCRRIRHSVPSFEIQTTGNKVIFPVSILASCDKKTAAQAAMPFKDKVVVFQATAPNESTDIFITPMTTALFSPQLMNPGAQFLADAVETLLNQDHPREPANAIKYILFLLAAMFGVLAGKYLQQIYLILVTLIFFSCLLALCFLNPITQLWPVTASMLGFIVGMGQVLTMQLVIGLKEGKLISQYMPRQIHHLLLSLKPNESFQNRRCQAVVLMSDLAGYTTVTGLLKDPAHVLGLMNDYLSDTSIVLQDKYNGWLEAYVGDLVCYYWPFQAGQPDDALTNALKGSVELAELQKQFFASLMDRYKDKIEEQTLKKITTIINAGVGISVGTVIMGDLGPEAGVRKFGVLGDPLNLASRVESLTRLFNTEIIVTNDFVDFVDQTGLVVRRLGQMSVKGRKLPAELYALGQKDDERFSADNIALWEDWLSHIEQDKVPMQACPEIFQKDCATIKQWLARGLLGKDGVWHLDEK